MPAHVTTPWGQALDRLMADHQWRTLDELVEHAGHLIPPGRAWRDGERAQARNRTTGTGSARTSDTGRDARGRRTIIGDLAKARAKRRKWDTRVVDGVRQWRARP